MKVFMGFAFLAGLVACARGVAYGPSNCVSLSRSVAGSCVISTNCEAHVHELDHFEFVFDCSTADDHDIVQHSFGVGGFDANEEFDTEVKCDVCAKPTPQSLAHDKQQPAAQQAKQVQTPDLRKATPSKAPRTYASLHAPSKARKAKVERPKTLVGLFHAHQAKDKATEGSATQVADDKEEEGTEAEGKEQKEKTKKKEDKEGKQNKEDKEDKEDKEVKEDKEDKEDTEDKEDKEEKEDKEDKETTDDKEDTEAKATSSKTARYGPDACVSTFKSKEGHCVMKTDCDAEAIKNYTFGLVCVDKLGAPVRHIFGKDSFDPEETFDTLIACETCMGLNDIPESITLNSQVMQLTNAVAGLGGLLKNISNSVEKLNEQVFADKKKKKGGKVEEASKEDATADADDGKAGEDEQKDQEASNAKDENTEDAGKDEEEAPAAKEKEEVPAEKEKEEEAPAAKEKDEEAPAAKETETIDDNSTETVESGPEPQTLPKLVKFHGSARRKHKHTRRAPRQHKHTRRGSLSHEAPVQQELKHASVESKHQELKHASVEAKHQEPRVVAVTAPKIAAVSHAAPAEVVEVKAAIKKTRNLRAGMNTASQQAAVSTADDADDSDDSDDSQDAGEDAPAQAESGGDDSPPTQYETAMQEQGNAPVQNANIDQTAGGAGQQVVSAVNPSSEEVSAVNPSPSEEQIQHEQEDQNSYQHYDDEPDEDRNGFESGDKFY